MLNHIKLEKIILLDIETVPSAPSFERLSSEWQMLWDAKIHAQRIADKTAEELYNRAGIYAEFGKIICISLGHFFKENNELYLKVKSYYGDDEKQLLDAFATLLNQCPRDVLLCAHNGKEFDFPYLCRRMLINQIKLPYLLDTAGKKPWEVSHADTMELWKFGDYKNYTSLNLLAVALGISTPKDDIDGSKVAMVYWQDHDLERIRRYCEKDVVTIAQLLMRFKGLDLLKNENIIIQ